MKLHYSLYFFTAVIVLPLQAKFSVDNIVSYVIPKKQEDVINYDHKLVHDGSIKIANTKGNISIKTWNQEHVHIEIIKKGTDKDIAEVSCETYFTSELISLTTQQPEKNSTEIDYNIIMPRTARATVTTDSGSIKINQLHNAISAQTDDGSINITDITHKTYARSGNGSIIAKVQSLPADGQLVLETENGDITTQLPEKTQGNLTAQAMHGKVTSELPVLVSPKLTQLNQEFWDQMKKDIRGTLGKGGAEIKLVTMDGNIKILES